MTYNFFATSDDLTAVFRAAEAHLSLKYTETGLFDHKERSVLSGFSELPNLGFVRTGDSNLEPSFLVLLADATLAVRPVPQRRGGMKYAVDQVANPGTVVLRPGGMFGDSAVIAGMLGTVHDDNVALMLLHAFSAPIEKLFRKTRSYFVGPGAGKQMELGARLTKSVKSPEEFDLRGD